MTKEAIQLQRAILSILSSIAHVISALEPVLQLSLKHLFECLAIPLLKKEASSVLLTIFEQNANYICSSDILESLLKSI